MLALSGCAATKKSKKSALDQTGSAPQGQTQDPAYVPGVDVVEASLRGSSFSQIPELESIRFDYDSAALSDAALATLKNNAAFLKAHAGLEVLVSGFCDERGTIEYNLALGQKRAKEVREYYIRLGIPGAAVATISYGKEQPVCTQSNDECWAQNRRAETRVRARPAADGSSASPDAP